MNVLTLEPNDLFSDEDGHDNGDNQVRVEWLTDSTLREYVTLARLKELQDATVVVHSTGRVALAESMREWVEQLTEALAMDEFWGTDRHPSAN